MLIYPALIEATSDRDHAELAAAAGLTLAELEALLAGGRAASPATKERLARALGANPLELFRAASRLSGEEVDLEPGFPANRYVTDAATLRQLDRPRAR